MPGHTLSEILKRFPNRREREQRDLDRRTTREAQVSDQRSGRAVQEAAGVPSLSPPASARSRLSEKASAVLGETRAAILFRSDRRSSDEIPGLMARSARGSGTFSKTEMKKGFRVLSRPKLGRGQTKVASPGVPRKK